MTNRPDLAVLVASLFHGGVGKMRVHLINEIQRRGHKVDLLVADMDSPYMNLVSPEVRIVRIPTSNAVSGIPSVAWYLRRARPRVMMSQRVRVNALAHRAKSWAMSDARMAVTLNTNMTSEIDALPSDRRQRHLDLMRQYFPKNDHLIAVSQGVADDTAQLIGMDVKRIRVAPNPVVTQEMLSLAEESLDDPWFAAGQPPVVLGVGRLEPQKDFVSLMKAFAKLRSTRPCRLIILGEGKLRGSLEELGRQLGISEDFRMPGFQPNPYAYMRHAALFVLSSAWEGSPNGLTEALALGTPLVATDCPNGPIEILEGGKHGPLVAVGDVDGLALAMASTLDNPPNRDSLRTAGLRYTLERSATAYIDALGLNESKQ